LKSGVTRDVFKEEICKNLKTCLDVIPTPMPWIVRDLRRQRRGDRRPIAIPKRNVEAPSVHTGARQIVPQNVEILPHRREAREDQSAALGGRSSISTHSQKCDELRAIAYRSQGNTPLGTVTSSLLNCRPQSLPALGFDERWNLVHQSGNSDGQAKVPTLALGLHNHPSRRAPEGIVHIFAAECLFSGNLFLWPTQNVR
jgi:hypothetical protein